jgi:hypothetical protein
MKLICLPFPTRSSKTLAFSLQPNRRNVSIHTDAAIRWVGLDSNFDRSAQFNHLKEIKLG